MKSGRSKLDKWDDLRMQAFNNPTQDEIKKAAKALKDGHLVAFPTETVYGLGADATNGKAVSRVYSVKARPTDHPLIVHSSSINQLGKWAIDIPEYAIKLAEEFWPGPMTLILKRSEIAKDFITGGQENVGVRVPSHPVALALISEFEKLGGLGVAAPSANRFGAVSPTSSGAVVEEIGRELSQGDLILDGGKSHIGIESTIIDCTKEKPFVLRPGAVTIEMLRAYSGKEVSVAKFNKDIKTSGLLEKHYSPKAKVSINAKPEIGEGFLAMADISTPYGVIRLASPRTIEEFAHQLYESLRLGDHKGLKKIIVVPPVGKGLSEAILDRLTKSAKS